MILVTGATGNVGSALVPTLQAQAADFKAFVRNPEKAEALRTQGVTVVEGDLGRPETLETALDGVDTVFMLSSVAPDIADLSRNVVDVAKANGSLRIVRMSALKAAPDAPTRISRLHAEADAYLQSSGVPYTILRSHFFTQNAMLSAPSVAAEGKMYFALGAGKLGMIDVRDVAQIAATTLTSAGHEGKIYTPTGPASVDFHAVAQALGSALGKEVSYVPVPTSAALESMREMGLPEWLSDGYGEYFDAYQEGYGDFTTSDFTDVTGQTARSVEDFARDFASAFTGETVAA